MSDKTLIGESLGHFRIIAKLGEGGMGEVYLAEDSKLGREVAIKVLPEAFVADPQRLARFEREAKVLASLSHPNIAGIYEVGQDGALHYLVMELAAGETLGERIDRGAIPATEALPIARQIVAALEAAHAGGIVHRDLKPANVTLAPDGTVKVLDFGLAKALDPEPGSLPGAELAHSPTLTFQATVAGTLLGTAAYMSPEQARGEAADRRSDIWSFGVVLWEMLTGRRLFEGRTVSDTLAGILRDEIELGELPGSTPPPLCRLLRRCLERDPERRLHDVNDARIVLEELAETDPELWSEPEPAAARARIRPLLTAAATLIGLLVGLGLGLTLRDTSTDSTPGAEPLHVGLHPPADVVVNVQSFGPGIMTPSPDGRQVVFAGFDAKDVLRLYVQDLRTGETRMLAGTDAAQYPFWSPDGRWLGFFSQQDATLKKIPADGGPAIPLAEAVNGKGGTWSQDGTIVFAPSYSSGLWRVPAAGGEAEPVTTRDPSRANSHRHPRFLPDGRHLIFVARSGDPDRPSRLRLTDLEGTLDREIASTQAQGEIVGETLFWVRDGALFAQPFDLAALELRGEASPVTQDLQLIAGATFAGFATSAAGLLILHAAVEAPRVQLEWRDREGRRLATVGEPSRYEGIALSPDGRRAITVESSRDGGMELWLMDLERGVDSRLTDAAGDQHLPRWSPDGSRIAYSSNERASFDSYLMSIGALSAPELLVGGDEDEIPLDFTPDGEALLYQLVDRSGAIDLWLAPLADPAAARPLMQTPEEETAGRISPDGRWLAFGTRHEGRSQLYLTSFPDIGARIPVSGGEGLHPCWRGDGRELFFIRPDGMVVSVPLEGEGNSVRLGATEELFLASRLIANGSSFDVSQDGQRFLVFPRIDPRDLESDARLVLDWRELLR